MKTILSLPVYLFHQGKNFSSYKFLGCHADVENNREGHYFRAWAPNAKHVAVVGDFNGWNRSANPMFRINDEGIWEAFIEGLKEFDNYKYAISAQNGRELLKSDPYAFHGETQSKTASKVYDIEGFKWSDGDWIADRAELNYDSSAINIYEVHLGSWKKHPDNREYSYVEAADSLVPYVKEMGYTHIELMPLAEYPFDDSWGYQACSYFAPTSRYGTPKDLMYFVNKCHENNIGVILDWVPAHFCKDSHGLYEFDGKPLYENPDPKMSEHKGWGTSIFHYARNEVQSFLISNALYWLNEYHFDGLRVDAVASMLYLDYDRKEGEWTPNIYGGHENLEAIQFIKNLSQAIGTHTLNCMFVAEESTSFANITKPVKDGGLGFTHKWNMGWMHDTLQYISKDPIYRGYEHEKLTFSMFYAYSEKFILPLSHDEVVHMKKSVLDKCAGDYAQKFATYRAFYGYMLCHPGKKLNFMGSEFGQFAEWAFTKELDWFLMQYEAHAKLCDYVKAANNLYKKTAELYYNDADWSGFEWLIVDDRYNNVFAFERKGDCKNGIICVCNFSNITHSNYKIGVNKGSFSLILNSDDIEFYGKGEKVKMRPRIKNTPWNNKEQHIEITVPANSCLLYKTVRQDIE